ncbi:hypothetical protein D9M68_890850 [compost metagenome]
MLDEFLRVVEGHPRVAGNVLAQLGRRHVTRQALEQRKAEHLLEVAQHLADSRLAEVHQFRCRMHVAGPGQSVDQDQMLELEPVAQAGKRNVGVAHRLAPGFPITKRYRILRICHWDLSRRCLSLAPPVDRTNKVLQ